MAQHKCILCKKIFDCTTELGADKVIMPFGCEGDYESYCQDCQITKFEDICMALK